jgi:hypothetical protein
MRRVLGLLLPGFVALAAVAVALTPGGYLGQVLAQAVGYQQTFDGTPATPTFWRPVDWDVSIFGHDMQNIEPMQAQHGADCSAPPNTHLISRIEETVYICNSHVMTAINNGYGAIMLTPNQLLDFSAGPAVLKWDMSTARQSSRDWVDVLLTPFEENSQVNFVDFHRPRNAVYLTLAGGNGLFVGSIWRNGVEERVSGDVYHTWDMIFANFGLTSSATRRDTFELTLSRTHMRLRMPAYNLTWIDADIPPLTWTQGVVQLNQRTYNPNKACDFDGTCGPNTWHWDNVSVAPAAQFTLLRADRRFVDASAPSAVTFPAAAPANAHLRFSGVGKPIEFSVNGGGTWTAATVQGDEAPPSNPEIGDAYWSPIPAGTRSVMIRGTRHGTTAWSAQDIAIWAPGPQVILPTQTPVVGGPTALPTAARTATPTPVRSSAVATATPTSISSSSPPSNPNQPSNPSNPSPPSNSGNRSSSRAPAAPAPVVLGESGGGGGFPALAFAPLPKATPAPAPTVFVAPPPVVSGLQLDAAGGDIAVDSLNLELSVPAEALGGQAVRIKPSRPALETLPPAPPALELGSDAFELALAPLDGSADLQDLVAPLRLAYRLRLADLARVGVDFSKLGLGLWTGAGWTPLPCAVGDDARLICSTSRPGLFAVLIASVQNESTEIDLPNGRFYAQANGFSGSGGSGFAVTDDADANLWAEFQRLGGVEQLGYPVSGRFVYRGFLTQAFQRLVLQWRPELAEAVPLNVLDDLSQRGTDPWLERTRQVPMSPAGLEDLGLPWDEVVARHLAVLEPYPALLEAYVNTPDALEAYGLPLSIKEYGTFVSVRLQRATLQLWLVDQPWAAAGTVVVGNAGDLAKEAGLWPLSALAPEPRPAASVEAVPEQ